ncbi:MAG: AMP-binding protein [Chloroflexi bacterium]|nr:AMP-binding protein [Chloroflexota bacterium]
MNNNLSHIIRHAYANAPTVRRILDAAQIHPDDITSIDDLSRIPVTTKDALVELQRGAPPFGGLLAVPRERLTHICMSPGPLYEPHAGESAGDDSIRAILAVAGFDAGDVVLNTFGYHFIPTGLAFDRTCAGLKMTVIPAGVGSADIQVKMMLDLGVSAYVGTPSWLAALLRKAEEMGINPRAQFALRKAMVSAEPLPPSLRQTLVEQYGLNVTNAYGTAELGFLAYNTESGMAMRLFDSPIIQVAHPETGAPVASGEVGQVVVTTFNETYPLIRFGTGDLAMNLDPAPGASRQGERSIILVGRVGEAVKVRGMFVHPNQLRFGLSQVTEIARAQAVVTRTADRDALVLRAVHAKPDAAAAARQSVAAAIRQAIQAACRVNADAIEWVDALPDDAKLIVDEREWK